MGVILLYAVCIGYMERNSYELRREYSVFMKDQ